MKKELSNPFFYHLENFFDYKGVNTALSNVKIKKVDDVLTFFMSVPGLSKKDLTIKLNGDIITIEYNNENELLFVNSFKKEYTIPENCNVNLIDAKVSDGVLVIKFPLKNKENIDKLISIN